MSDQGPQPDRPEPTGPESAVAPAPPPPPPPAYQAPAYQAPAYQAPAYQAPVYQPSLYPASATQTPGHGSPGYAAPGYGPVDQDYPAPAAPANPGQTLGIVGIVLGVLLLWLIGLPLSIVSIVRSGRAGASRTLGFVGLAVNVLAMLVGLLLAFAVLLPAINLARHAADDLTASPIATASAEPTPEPAEPAEPTPAPEPGTVEVVALDQPYTIGGLGHGYWALNDVLEVPGWELTAFDEAGVNELTRADGLAFLTTYQGQDGAYAGMPDSDASSLAIADLLGLPVAEVTPTVGTMVVPSAFGGPSVELAVLDWTDGATHAVVAGRVFAEGHYLVLSYSAPADSFDPADWDTLVALVSVDDSGT